jgi:hypothetical protein
MYFKEIEHKGRKFVYDFTLLNVEQAELAREAGEFKFNQSQIEPESFKSVLKSNGADWLSIIGGYLLLEMVDGEIQEFNKDKAELETEKFIKGLPATETIGLRGIVQDFFTSIGQEKMILQILQNVRRKNAIETLLPILLRSQMMKSESE